MLCASPRSPATASQRALILATCLAGVLAATLLRTADAPTVRPAPAAGPHRSLLCGSQHRGPES